MGDGVLKYLSGKVVGAILGVAAVLVIIWYWRLAPADRATMWSVARGTLIWAGFVAVLPWALFFVPIWAMRAESNLVSALVLVGFLGVDAGMALYLAGGRVNQGWQWAALLLGFLCAAFYNFIVCEFLARRSEDSA